jgi:hypothetical protein
MEAAARTRIAIRIGTSGDEPPLLEPGSGLVPVALPELAEFFWLPFPWLPCWPDPFSPPEATLDFEGEPPFPPDDFAPDDLALPACEPMPLVELEPPEIFDSLGGLPPVTVGGASEYW